MTNRVGYLIAIILLASPAGILAQERGTSSEAEVLTLDKAVSLALGENRQVKNAQLSVGQAGDAVAAARTLRLPSMYAYSLVSQQLLKHDAGTDGSGTDVLPGVGPFFSIGTARKPTAIFAGQILQPLSQQYRIRLDIEQAGLARDVEGEKLRQAQQTTVNQVRQTYYGILQTQSAFDSLQEVIGYYRELDRVTVDNVTQQVSLKADSLEVKTRLAKAEYEALNLTNQLATEKEQLNNLLGRDVRAEFQGGRGSRRRRLSKPTSPSRELTRSTSGPNCAKRGLKVRQAEVERRIKKSEYIPDVSLAFTYMSFRNFDDDAFRRTPPA
jgi:outer membrane protein TolC